MYRLLATILALVLSVAEGKPSCMTPTAKQEKWLFSQIDGESKRLYKGLDCEDKNWVMELVFSGCFEDKNLAIQYVAKQAAQKK